MLLAAQAAQAARAQAKANAVDAYQAMREAASPRSQPQPGRKEPSEKHVQVHHVGLCVAYGPTAGRQQDVWHMG